MSTAQFYTKEKVDELLGKYFILPSNITINTNGITIGDTTIGSGSITTSTITVKNSGIIGSLYPAASSSKRIGDSNNK